jgi:hypothetical protein
MNRFTLLPSGTSAIDLRHSQPPPATVRVPEAIVGGCRRECRGEGGSVISSAELPGPEKGEVLPEASPEVLGEDLMSGI